MTEMTVRRTTMKTILIIAALAVLPGLAHANDRDREFLTELLSATADNCQNKLPDRVIERSYNFSRQDLIAESNCSLYQGYVQAVTHALLESKEICSPTYTWLQMP